MAAFEEDVAVGLAIGSFFSVSLEPPLVGFCVAKYVDRRGPTSRPSGRFGISVLAEDQTETSGRFASKVEDKFEGVTWEPSPVTGSPFIHGAVSHIDCELDAVHEAGDHFVVLGLVRALDIHRDDVGPLLFFKGSYGRHVAL